MSLLLVGSENIRSSEESFRRMDSVLIKLSVTMSAIFRSSMAFSRHADTGISDHTQIIVTVADGDGFLSNSVVAAAEARALPLDVRWL